MSEGIIILVVVIFFICFMCGVDGIFIYFQQSNLAKSNLIAAELAASLS